MDYAVINTVYQKQLQLSNDQKTYNKLIKNLLEEMVIISCGNCVGCKILGSTNCY